MRNYSIETETNNNHYLCNMPFPNKDTQFKPGESGNPKGRPPVPSLKSVLKNLIDSQAPKAIIDLAYVQKLTEKKDLTYNDVLALRLATAALVEGDIAAIKEIFDRLEGKAQQTVDVTTGGDPINQQIIINPVTAPPLSKSESEIDGSKPST